MLLGSDKSGQWTEWHNLAILRADELYDTHLEELRAEGLLDDEPLRRPDTRMNSSTMPNTASYRELHDRVAARPGATERLAALRLDTLAEIGLYELRRSLERSQTDIAAELGIGQPAVSQLERGDDVKLSTLRGYLDSLGARLQILAIFDGGEAEMAILIRIGASA